MRLFFFLPSLSLSLSFASLRSFPLSTEFRSQFPLRFRGERGTGTTLGRGTTGIGGGGRQGSSPPGGCAPPSFCVLQSRSSLIADGVLPRAPLPQDPSSHDGHLSAPVTSLTACSLRTLSLALTLSLSLALLAGTLGQHPRYTATRSGVAALASSPAVSARRRNSFLPACQPACLPTCLPTLVHFSFPLPPLSPSLSRTHPYLPARLKPTTTVVPALAVTLTA